MLEKLEETKVEVNKTIREYLPNVIHMSLATCKDGKPWVCEVHYVYDYELNLYWRSKSDRRHSVEIAENPNVAGNIVEQHGQGVAPRGVYFEGTAELLQDVTVDSAVYKLFVDRFGLAPKIVEEATLADGHKFYKVNVSDWYLFDARESRPSQKYHLER